MRECELFRLALLESQLTCRITYFVRIVKARKEISNFFTTQKMFSLKYLNLLMVEPEPRVTFHSINGFPNLCFSKIEICFADG